MHQLPGYDDWLVRDFEQRWREAEIEAYLLEEIEQTIRHCRRQAGEAVSEYIGSSPAAVDRWESAVQVAAEHGDMQPLARLIDDAITQEGKRRLEKSEF